MKRKVFVFLLLFLPVFVFAEEKSIELKSIELDEKFDTCLERTPATIEDNDVNLDLKMENVGDYATYKVTIKNNSNENLTIYTNQNKSSEYLKYTILEDNTSIIKGEEKGVYS